MLLTRASWFLWGRFGSAMHVVTPGAAFLSLVGHANSIAVTAMIVVVVRAAAVIKFINPALINYFIRGPPIGGCAS